MATINTDMKKTLFALLFLAISANLFAQTFRVQSMVELTHDLSARISPRVDASGKECALIRLNIPSIKDAVFESPIVGEPIIEPGEYTVYVPSNSKELQFSCNGQSVKVDFSRYQVSLQPKASYRIVVSRNSFVNESPRTAGIMVSANYDNDILLVDGIPMGQLPLVLDDIEVGSHTFAVPNTNGRGMKDTIIEIIKTTHEIVLFLQEASPILPKLDMDMVSGMDGTDIFDSDPIWGLKKEKRNGKMGIVDYTGRIIVPFQYDGINWSKEYNYGTYSVFKKDSDGTSLLGYYKPGIGEILPCRYLCSRSGWDSDWGSLWKIKEPGAAKYWLVDSRNGKFVLPDQYADIHVYERKYITVVDANRNTLIMNIKGEVLLSIPYAYVGLSLKNGLLAINRENQRVYDLTNKGGRPIPSQYKGITVSDGLIAVQSKATNKIGYLDRYMREIIPVNYTMEDDWLTNNYYFEHGTIVLYTDNSDTIVFNNKGAVIAQTTSGGINSYRHIEKLYSGKIMCEKTNGEVGVVDSAGHIIVPFTKDSIRVNASAYSYGDAYIISSNNGERKVIDSKGKTLLDWGDYKDDTSWMWRNIFVDRNPYAVLALTKNHFIINDKNGNRIVQIPVSQDAVFDYNSVSDDEKENHRIEIKSANYIIRRTKDDRLFQIINSDTRKYGFVSANGELLTSCIYDEIIGMFDIEGFDDDDDYFMEKIYPGYSLIINSYTASEGYGIIRLGDRFGYIDVTGKVVVPMIYTAATPFINGEAFVRDQNNKWTKIYSKKLK